jgi:hypothetical protein
LNANLKQGFHHLLSHCHLIQLIVISAKWNERSVILRYLCHLFWNKYSAAAIMCHRFPSCKSSSILLDSIDTVIRLIIGASHSFLARSIVLVAFDEFDVTIRAEFQKLGA